MLNPLDFIIDTYKTGTAWMPSISGIQITHVPSNIIVRCDSERSAHANRAKAWENILEMLEGTTDTTKQLELF